MYLPTNSTICVTYALFPIDWYFSSSWIVFLCFFVYLVVFLNWVSDILSSILLRPGYFCILINILEVFSGMQLSSLETVRYFWGFILSFDKQEQSNI